jgi:hypothetical protein
LFSQTTETFSQTTETFSQTTETFSQTTEMFSQTTETFSQTTETFSQTTEMFSQTTEMFSQTTEMFSQTTEMFSQTTETFSLMTEKKRAPGNWNDFSFEQIGRRIRRSPRIHTPIMTLRASLSAIVAFMALALPTTSLADWHGGWGYRCGFYPVFWRPSVAVSFYGPPSPYYYGGPYCYGGPCYHRSCVSPSDCLGADVQAALQRRGYYHGAIDGVIGAGSRAAIRAYQHDRGLAVTGRIDAALVHSLRIG